MPLRSSRRSVRPRAGGRGPAPRSRSYLQSAPSRRRRRRPRGNALFWSLVVLLVAAVAWGAVSAARTVWPPKAGTEGTASRPKKATPVANKDGAGKAATSVPGISIKVGTFLGGPRRDYYGNRAPDNLRLKWKLRIGAGKTIALNGNHVFWAGMGWTGQPTVVQENGKTYLISSGYDHGLRKIDAATGKVVWRYGFDDVIKSTNTVFVNPRPTGRDDSVIVVAGSRRGYPYDISDPRIAPFRAISYFTGKELWRLPVPKTDAYSRDVDSSGLLIDGLYYEGIEPAYMYALDVNKTLPWREFRRPQIVKTSPKLYDRGDIKTHGDNLCLEGSPGLIGDTIYQSVGSGHVYGLTKDLKVVWDFEIGSDIDATAVVNRDDRLLITVEKQHIKGHGGVYMLDPSKDPKDAAVWYFPTPDRGLGEWLGGSIGSVAINDSYNKDGSKPALAAFTSVDGHLYVVSQDVMDGTADAGPNLEKGLPKPKLVFEDSIGGAISTPIIVGDKIVVGGYDRKVHLYEIAYDQGGVALKTPAGTTRKVSIREVDTFQTGGAIESTPVAWNGRIYIGSRDGYLYALGD